jgi:anthranilate synthase component 1
MLPNEHANFIPVFEELRLDPHAHPLDVFTKLLERFPEYATGAFYLQRSQPQGETHTPSETILAFDPFETLRFRQGRVTIENREGRKEHDANPFHFVSERLAHYRSAAVKDIPSFQGGALGYFSYDSVRFLEPVLTTVPGNLRTLTSEGKGFDAEFMFFRRMVIFDHIRQRVFLMVGHFPGQKSVAAEMAALRDAYLSLAPPVDRKVPASDIELPTDEMDSMLGKSRFLGGVKKLKNHIRDGDIFQAVLSEKFSTPFKGDPLELFRTLSQMSPAPYQFYFRSGERVYLGASPEMLLKVTGTELETHPIAGTRPRGANEAEERRLESQLLRSEKEKAEHLMLVDLARNDVGRVSAPGTVRVGTYMEIRKFSGVMHLVSKVTGQLKAGVSSIGALAACFPAGTLSGAPKIRAMQLLSELEPKPRGFYGGAVVAASFTGDLDSCIAIRCIQIEEGIATIQAGAGIVADSQAEREYEEVQHKSRMARRALALAALAKERT